MGSRHARFNIKKSTAGGEEKEEEEGMTRSRRSRDVWLL